METRLVVFLLLLAALFSAFGLGGYRSFLSEYGKIDVSKKLETPEEKLAKANAAVKKVEPGVIDMSNPQIKNGFELYTKTGQCITCHGQDGEGNPGQLAPALGGQHVWYLTAQLKAMKSGERVNEKMNPYLKNLGDKEFEDLAQYITLLKGRQ